MGCGPSSETDDPNNNLVRGRKGGNIAVLFSEPETEDVDVPKYEAGYPQPAVPKGKREDIVTSKLKEAVDERARTTPPEKANSYEALIAYLTEGYRTDIEKVRSIFMWIGHQDIKAGNFSGATNRATPRGFMKLMKENKASYSSFFALLCRKAGLPCVIIPGFAKSVTYEVGDGEEKVKELTNSWNAVYCDGNWRFVFPLWACSATTGYSSGNYTKVEAKGQAVREKENQNAGVSIKQLNEFYFFPDPEVLVHMAFPEDNRWLLMEPAWAFTKFVNIPHCRQSYFKEKVEIKSKFCGRLEATNGECNIELTCEDTNGFSMDYELFFNNKESGKELSDKLQLNNYVMLNRTMKTWTFSIRFPESGVYKIEIVGGRSYEVDLCYFKTICDTPMEDCKPLPFNPGKIGYGPNQVTELAGIQAQSHKTAIVKLFAKKQVVFQFRLTRTDVLIQTELIHTTLSSQELSQYCTTKQTKQNVSVEVCVPEDGEYALKLNAKQKDEGTYVNVCNYLLTSAENKVKKRREWENPIEKRTRQDIRALSTFRGTNKIEELEQAIEKFHKLDMDDKGDLKTAENALEFKKDKKELDDAIKRRHLSTLHKAIDQGKKSRFREKLTKEIGEAEDVRDHLIHLSRIAHDILEMKQSTIAELKSYKYPPPIIYDIMKSTFLMLGEKESNLKEWQDLQALMGKTTPTTLTLIRRVKMFDTVTVQPDTKCHVESTLTDHSETDVRAASAGAGTFYVWLRNVCKAIGSKEEDQTTKEIS